MKKYLADSPGFTLIEIVVAMGLAVIVFTVLVLFESQFNNATLFISQELNNQQGLDQTFSQVMSAIRSAGQSSVGSYPIESASSTSFVFYSDINNDGLFERVRYTITSSTLEQGTVKPTGNPLVYVTSTEAVRELVMNVLPASSTFTYFDANYTGTQNPMTYPIDVSKIRLVRLNLIVDQNINSSPKPIVFSQLVDIRNLRSN